MNTVLLAVSRADRILTGCIRKPGSFPSDHEAASVLGLDGNVVCADLLHTPSATLAVNKQIKLHFASTPEF